MALKIFFVLAICAAATRHTSVVSPKCKEEVRSIQTKEKAAAVGECEKKGQYPQKAIQHLQQGDRNAAIATIEESFQTCAKFSEPCAKELAPRVIQSLEFSGAAITYECKSAVTKVQSDQVKMQQVKECENKTKHTENVMAALDKNDLDAAVGSAKKGLKECMGLSEKCATQLAPFVVNQVVMKSLEAAGAKQETPMTTVFASAMTPVLAAATSEKISLIGTVLDEKSRILPPTRGMSFLQRGHVYKRFVSRMLMHMAR